MRKAEIIKILKDNEIKFNNSDNDINNLYQKLLILDKSPNQFDYNKYNELIKINLYLFHVENGIENLCYFKLPRKIPMNVSYNDFDKYLERLTKYRFKNKILPEYNTVFKELYRIGRNKLCHADFNWIRIYSSIKTGIEPEIAGKIYLSVDNKDLHKFSTELLVRCVNSGLSDYEFKINNNDKITRKDNVVIYFTKDNYQKYIGLINEIYQQEIIEKNDNNPLAYEVSDGICVANEIANGVSYSKLACSLIINCINKGLTEEEAVTKTDKFLREKLRSSFEAQQVKVGKML